MPREQLKVGLHGAAGRMGLRLVQLIAEDQALRLSAALERSDHSSLGQDAGTLAGIGSIKIPLTPLAEWDGVADVVIDFSYPEATLELARFCQSRRLPLVVGTTGFDPQQRHNLERSAADIALLISPNMSRAVNLLFRLVGEAARSLRDSADIEIIERHHKLKKDSPSGTALRLAEVAAEAAGRTRFVHGRHGLVGERPVDEIGIHALRAGDAPGEHTVVFGLMGESLELSHKALNRDGFVRGAIDAAKYLAGKPPGLYTMANLLE